MQKNCTERKDNDEKLPKYLIISIIIVAVFIGIGYISYITTGEAWLTVRTYGGEMTGNIGIGFMVDSYYPLFGWITVIWRKPVLYSTRFSSCFHRAVYRHTVPGFCHFPQKRHQRVCLNNCLPAAYIDDLIWGPAGIDAIPPFVENAVPPPMDYGVSSPAATKVKSPGITKSPVSQETRLNPRYHSN